MLTRSREVVVTRSIKNYLKHSHHTKSYTGPRPLVYHEIKPQGYIEPPASQRVSTISKTRQKPKPKVGATPRAQIQSPKCRTSRSPTITHSQNPNNHLNGSKYPHRPSTDPINTSTSPSARSKHSLHCFTTISHSASPHSSSPS
jgi:hypothetical protein